jgi:uncharacterized cupredoxin-like copper-binding protein
VVAAHRAAPHGGLTMKRIVVAAVALALLASGCGGAATAPAADEATIGIRHSQFGPAVLTVPVGLPITITLRNDDPIEHEWIVGNADVHQRHRDGTEPYHDTIPTEVTLAPLQSKDTTVTFDTPGDYAFICHLPGHEAYGMKGMIRVR